MKNITVSLKSLYDEFNGQLEHGEIIKEIDGEFEYYDLQTAIGTVCMDGELCQIVDSGEFGYELLNTYGESDMTFILTNEEYNIGVFENLQNKNMVL